MTTPEPIFICPGCFKPVCRHCGGCECREMPCRCLDTP